MSDPLLRLITPLHKAEQVLLICRDALPGVLAAIRSLERTIQTGETELAAITAACSRHRVSRLYLFGSLLRPDYRPGESDIDLLVEFQTLQPTELVDAYFGLEEQLTDSLGTVVDLVMATARRNPIVQADIDATRQLLYAA